MGTPAPVEPEQEAPPLACNQCQRSDIPVLSLEVGRRKPVLVCAMCLARVFDEQLGWKMAKLVENMLTSLLMADATRLMRQQVRAAIRGDDGD